MHRLWASGETAAIALAPLRLRPALYRPGFAMHFVSPMNLPSLPAWSLVIGLLSPWTAGALTVSGTLGGSTTWRAADSPVLVTGDVTILAGATLTITDGVTIRLAGGVSISTVGGALDVAGTANRPVRFEAQTPNLNWGVLAASGANATLTLRHAELANGGINLGAQATGLFEDTFIHDVNSAVLANSAKLVTLRRVHVKNYSETVFNSGTVILAEDSLFENMTLPNSDALEIQDGPPGSIIRRCTFRHSTGVNSDAIDFNGTAGVLIHDCLIYDFSDKGVSLGAAGPGGPVDHGIIVSNCCIYAVNTGVAVKDGSTAALYQLTIFGCANAVRLYQKYSTPVDGGHVTNGWNNLFWNNSATINLKDNSSFVTGFSDLQGTNWPGVGNQNIDPQFRNPAQNDFRLAANSPLRGAGGNGADVGASFPVGAAMASSHPLFTDIRELNGRIRLRYWIDPERTYTLRAASALSGSGGGVLSSGITDSLPVEREMEFPLDPAVRFFWLESVVNR